ncbi:MAG: hypothetical protein NC432_10900 [Roseburia sp.]|nr:hypothetical protein [Roseburia sp.]MCM1099220.1 hypothetical protein [Ruminococcus flavefaciens]
MWKQIGLATWLTTLSVCDGRKKSVPLWLLGLGGAIAVAALIEQGVKGGLQPGPTIHAVLPGATLLFLAAGTGKAGYADGLVLVVLGIAEGYQSSLIICMSSLALAALVSGILLLTKRAGRNTRIPFVPFLEAGWLIAVCAEWGGL